MSFLKSLFGAGAPQPPAHTGKLFESPYADEINGHFTANFPGRTDLVWQDEEGMQIHLLAPTEQEPYYVAYTVGMSANLMHLDNMPHNRRYDYLRTAELMLYLPAGWPMAGLLAKPAEEEPDRNCCWPLRMLYRLACMPEKGKTWLGAGHSIPNGEPPRPLADNTRFCGAMLYLPADKNGPKTVQPVNLSGGGQVLLYVTVPVYADEMEMKLQKGADWLEADLRELPDYSGFIVNVNRPSVAPAKKEE